MTAPQPLRFIVEVPPEIKPILDYLAQLSQEKTHAGAIQSQLIMLKPTVTLHRRRSRKKQPPG